MLGRATALHENNKKRRRTDSTAGVSSSSSPAAPIIFTSPGLKPDVRLNVLGTDFHVHSIILKLHSNFFRRFLDSPDKHPAPDSALFRYEYSSVIETDGASAVKWVLEPGRKVSLSGLESHVKSRAPSPQTLVLDGPSMFELPEDFKTELEVDSFRKLLCAMYNRPYAIRSVFDLTRLINLADYYCALPIVSATLSGALLGSSIFGKTSWLTDVRDPRADLLILAMKLRHPILFREAFIHVVGRWDPSKMMGIVQENSELMRLVMRESHAIYIRTMDTQLVLLRNRDEAALARGILNDDESETMDAKFYRAIMERLQDDDPWYVGYQELRKPLDALLQNNLMLDHNGSLPGMYPYEDCFLCANVSDEEMPWNRDEVDW
ncbi:hypothetical protein EG329_003074 [Mollisiaceae sp. DMI_Dod_QoI]|nr:hypothetical protein EG329_003074 [Helotiales sp. DMI_Dod_QoI]